MAGEPLKLEINEIGRDDSASSGVLDAPSRKGAMLSISLFALIGVAPYSAINAMSAEMPYLKHVVPEGKQISSFVSGAANVGTLLAFAAVYALRQERQSAPVVVVVVSAFSLMASMIVIALFWRVTLSGHSVVLLGASAAVGFFGSLYAIVLYASLSQWSAIATTSMSVDMGLTGVALSFLAIAQRAGASPYFALPQFMVVTCMLTSLSLCCSLLVRYVPRLTAMHVDTHALIVDVKDAVEDDEVPAVIVNAQDQGHDTTPWSPVLHQFAKSAMVYMTPGLGLFLTDNDAILRWLMFTTMFANFSGHLITSLKATRAVKLAPLNAVILFALLYEFAVALKTPGIRMIPSAMLVPVACFSAFANGWLGVQAYLRGDALVGVNIERRQRLRSAVTIAHQAGSIVGTYTMLGLSYPLRRL